ncbi:intermembrane transport protein PqiB [Alteromonas sp. ASW11-130]|uniref:intermembrane transport protein PqiB n=1 Tax=Alteromonas sp. ASW11-130 TaxID=3015775 RepID=UPI00224223C5|nr:intermembrane transport protein PqiB [Alteromonas sp. ASW11-130]MCW8091355.1 intermembrane transport protein PqiB [Alteromonas sp. ASW11-130]
MNENAHIKPTSTVSKIWIIPILVLIVGGWLVWYQWSNQGPMITIEMRSAAGIEVNKTPIKVRDLNIGQVKKIELKQDLEGVLVHARIDAGAAQLLTDKAQFWVVSPRISFSEVSGLSTLLSGAYIAMSASDKGVEQHHFVAQERPPVTPPGTPGLHLSLTSDDELAYKPGDPIIYKGFKVGEFEDSSFNIDERVVYYEAFIEAPYHKLITQNTRFWNVSGVKLNLESSGVKIETGSLETLLANGITFGIPEGVYPGEQVTENAFFTIFEDQTAAINARFKLAAEYLLLIDETVRGLKVGAPVEYRGIEIGEVRSINAGGVTEGNILQEDFPIPVVISIYPGKVRQDDSEQGLEFVKQTMKKWIAQDLRASLRMGNVLTGGLYVDLNHVEEHKAIPLRTINGLEVIPTVSNEFTQLTQKADAILDKINQLPLDTLIGDIGTVIADLGEAATSVKTTADNFDTLVKDIDAEQLNGNLNEVLDEMSALLRNFSEGGLSKSETQETMDSLQETLRNIQPILLQLNQKPNGLFFATGSEMDVQPKAKNSGANK